MAKESLHYKNLVLYMFLISLVPHRQRASGELSSCVHVIEHLSSCQINFQIQILDHQPLLTVSTVF